MGLRSGCVAVRSGEAGRGRQGRGAPEGTKRRGPAAAGEASQQRNGPEITERDAAAARGSGKSLRWCQERRGAGALEARKQAAREKAEAVADVEEIARKRQDALRERRRPNETPPQIVQKEHAAATRRLEDAIEIEKDAARETLKERLEAASNEAEEARARAAERSLQEAGSSATRSCETRRPSRISCWTRPSGNAS